MKFLKNSKNAFFRERKNGAVFAMPNLSCKIDPSAKYKIFSPGHMWYVRKKILAKNNQEI